MNVNNVHLVDEATLLVMATAMPFRTVNPDALLIQGGRQLSAEMSIGCCNAEDYDSDLRVTTSSGTFWSRFPATLAISAKWGSAGELYLGLGRTGDPD